MGLICLCSVLQMAFYMCFREAHPDVLVGKCVFDSLQPYWIKNWMREMFFVVYTMLKWKNYFLHLIN